MDQRTLAKLSKYFEGSASFPGLELIFDSKIVSFEALQMLVKFLETGDLKSTPNNFEQLLLAADYLQIDSAMTHLVEYLQNNLKSQMFAMRKITKKQLIEYLRMFPTVRRYEIKHNFKHQQVLLACDNDRRKRSNSVCIGFLLAHHFKRIMYVKEVMNLDRDRIYELLSSDQLRISEEDVLKTIKMWINFGLEERREHFRGLLSCVRPDPSLSVGVFVLLCGPLLHNTFTFRAGGCPH